MTDRLPKYERPTRMRNPREPVRPLPSVPRRATSDSGPSQRHETLAKRYGEIATRLIAFRAKLEEACAVDAAEERAAAEAGRKPKRRKSLQIEDELEDAERELHVVG